MGIKAGDLVDTILSKISIDEFEPKTGKSKDVTVVGFNVTEESAGQDLNNFLNSSIHDIRDVEVSPNPNKQGYFMVFVELDRNEKVFDNIMELVSDVKNVSGNLKWKASTHLTDEYYPLESEELKRYIITDPDNYLTKEEWEEQVRAEDERLAAEEEASDNSNSILEFLKDSSLLEAGINDNKIVMRGSKDVAQLEVVNFGPAKDIMAEVGINESAIKPLDSTLRKFNSMLGEMRAVPIDEYIVIFHPSQDNVLVTKQC